MASPVSFDGRVAIVTGAGGGMGRSHAKVLARHGARVVVNDVRNAGEVVAEIRAEGGEAVPDEHDISDDEGARGLVQTAVDAFGRLDSIVNNAGISSDDPFPDISWELFDRIMKVNTYGPFFITKYAWPYLIESGSGRVVMIASKAALSGGPPNRTHYAASKGAVLSMARRLAYNGLPHGIFVNTVLPTAVTPMIVKGQVGFQTSINPSFERMAKHLGVDPSDATLLAERSTSAVSAVVAWLCHPECSSNGETINAIAGEVGRVSIAVGVGIDEPDLSIETVRDRFDSILDMTDASLLPAVHKL